MPEKRTVERAKKAKAGKPASTQAGEFVREEMHHVAEGKHGAKSRKQAVAIGLSKARRAGVDLKPPKKGAASTQTRKKAERDLEKGAAAKRDDKNESASKTATRARKRTRTEH